MNKVHLCGRLTRDPRISYTSGSKSTCVAKYTLAVERTYKKGDQTADFPQCIAFGKPAEIAEKYIKKGMKIIVHGRIQTSSYTAKDGTKVYNTDVIVEEQEFVESKSAQQESKPSASEPAPAPVNQPWMTVPDGIESELPFV